MMQDVEILKGYIPGAIGRVVELHGVYYHNNWRFGVFFEAKVARELAGFMARYDENQDGFWTVSTENGIQGSIAIDGANGKTAGAHLRWFVVSDALRGRGLGCRLLHTAINFCKTRGYSRIYLWTFEGLLPARHLYEGAGFELTEQHRGRQWGTSVTEQRFERGVH